MTFFQDYGWWLIGFLIITAICVLVMLMRNRAAKSDAVLHSENDTVLHSVSLNRKNNTRKLE